MTDMQAKESYYKTAIVNTRFIRATNNGGNLAIGFTQGDYVAVKYQGHKPHFTGDTNGHAVYEISGAGKTALASEIHLKDFVL